MNAGGSRWLFGRPDEIHIENDTLFVYQYDVEDDNSVHRFPVITKEEFILCYNTWIKGENNNG